MEKKVILALLMGLMLFAPAMAIERQQSGDTQGSGLTISVPEQWTFAQYKNTTLRFYVHNTTNYALLTNTTTACNIYLYRPDGTYIIGTALTFDSPISNYFIWLNGSVYLTHTERQHFYVYCNSTTGAHGFVESYYDVTWNGKEPPGNNLLIFGIIIFLALVAAMIYFSFTVIEQFVKLNVGVDKVAYNVIVYIVMMLFSFLNAQFFGVQMFNAQADFMLNVGMWTNIILPFTAFVLTLVIGQLRKMGKLGIKGDDMDGEY